MNATLPPTEGSLGNAELSPFEMLLRRHEKSGYFDASFKHYYTQLQPDLYAFICGRIGDVPEAVAYADDCFNKTWRTKQVFKEELSLKKYLMSCARNQCNSHLERTRRRRTAPLPEDIPTEESIDPEMEDEKNVRLQQILAIAEKLPPHQKKIFDERYKQDKEYEEIARDNGQDENYIRKVFSNALKNIKKKISEIKKK